MRRALIFALVISAAMTLTFCEKDDICDPNTATTPRLVLRFFDANNPSVGKDVTNLAIIGDGLEIPYDVINSTDSLLIPMRTDQDFAGYRFILNSNDEDLINADHIALTYARNDLFVSRACGYKTLFVLDENSPFVLDPMDDGAWIQNITVAQPSIETEDETHLNIYF